MADPPTRSRNTNEGVVSAAEGLWLLWQRGGRPDLDAYLAGVGRLSPSQVSAVLRVDQQERWRTGDHVSAEAYLARYPEVGDDPEAAMDLIHGEFLFREREGDGPDPEEYLRRFPKYRGVLKAQLDLHLALGLTDTNSEPLPSTPFRTPPDSGPVPVLYPFDPGCGARGVDAGAGTAPPDPAGPDAHPALPEMFGRYRIARRLGRGGMGTVYLAHDTQLDRTVALKVPHFDSGSARLVQRFYREARIAAAFNHPHLCPVYDVGQVDGTHYLTMPFLGGETLSSWMRDKGPLAETAAARLAALIARAVQVAHEAGVIHRDLKPANVMIDDRQDPIVMDFGLARDGGHRSAALTGPGVLIGTPAYSPPEQIVGDSGAMVPESDVYSLGIILYEMLTGRLPFQGPLHEVVRAVLALEPDPPTRARPDLDPALEAICLTAIAKEPPARFPSMAAFAEALEGWLRDGTRCSPRTQPARRGLWVTRRAAALVVAGLCAVSLGAVAWTVTRHRDGPSGRARAPDGLQAGTKWFGAFLFRPPMADYDGDVEVAVTSRDRDHFRGIYTTERGAYSWEIEGTIRGKSVGWRFTRVIHLQDSEGSDVVGRARVEGELRGETMEVVFDNPGAGTADMTLRLQR